MYMHLRYYTQPRLHYLRCSTDTKLKCHSTYLSARPFQRLSVLTFLSISFFHSMPCRVVVVMGGMVAEGTQVTGDSECLL